MPKPLITEDTSLVAGHVPKPTVECLDIYLSRGWRNKLIIALCGSLEIIWQDEGRDPELDSFDQVIERGLLAMAPSDQARERIYRYLHDE